MKYKLGKAIFVRMSTNSDLYSCGEENWSPYLTPSQLAYFGATPIPDDESEKEGKSPQ